jgi:hypothetical protein
VTEVARRSLVAIALVLIAFVAFIAVEGKEGRNGEKVDGSPARVYTARCCYQLDFD